MEAGCGKHDQTKGYTDGNLREIESWDKSIRQRCTGRAGSDLDMIAREGARQMLVSALEVEVTEFLGRQQIELVDSDGSGAGPVGYRNGHGRARRVTLGTGTVEVRVPRVLETAETFTSQAVRFKQQFEGEYEARRARSLADHHRCWVHKMRNVLVCFPKRLLQQIYAAEIKKRAETLMAQFAEMYGRTYPLGVECLCKDREALLTCFVYSKEHRVSLKTTNPIESIFVVVRLRTDATRRIKSLRSALYLIFQLIHRAQKIWRRVSAPRMVEKVLDGVTFEDGTEIRNKRNYAEKSAA